MSAQKVEFDAAHPRDDHAYWARFCTCGLAEQERTGHYPEHEDWCDVPSPLDDEDEDVCGYTFDHDAEETYSGPDGYQWVCRRCGAEGWEDAEPTTPGVTS